MLYRGFRASINLQRALETQVRNGGFRIPIDMLRSQRADDALVTRLVIAIRLRVVG